MKKIVLVLTVALMGFVMNAQPPRPHMGHGDPGQMLDHRVQHLAKALDLTEEQQAEITKIYVMEMEAMKNEHQPMATEGKEPVRPDESVMKARKEQMEARRAETDAKIEALLTPEQAAKYAELKKGHEGKPGFGDRHHGDRHHGDRKPPRHDGGCCCKCKQDQ